MDVFQICTTVILVSFTSVIATGSLLLVCGMICVLFGKDVD